MRYSTSSVVRHALMLAGMAAAAGGCADVETGGCVPDEPDVPETGLYVTYPSPDYSTSCSVHSFGSGALVAGNAEIRGCAFVENHAEVFGGGVTVSTSAAVINSVFVGNTAGCSGGGIWLSASQDASVTVAHCTFWSNDSPTGGAIFADGNCTVVGSIVWNGMRLDAGQIDTGRSGISITHSAIQCGWPGEGNIGLYPVADDPRFVDGIGADGVPGTADDDLHLAPGSPCIDAGDPSTTLDFDIDGHVRPAGSGYDMGAYEDQS